MCGITAILSKNNKNISNLLILSLKNLENRGYDACGISYFDSHIKTIKYANSDNIIH